MKNLSILLLIIFFAFLETTIIPLHLTLLAVILWASMKSNDQALGVAFLAGLILDLLGGKPLGQTSLLFSILTLFILLYKNRFHADQLRFLLPFSVIAVIPNDLIFGSTHWPNFFLEIMLLVVLLPALRFLSKMSEESRPRLTFDLPGRL